MVPQFKNGEGILERRMVKGIENKKKEEGSDELQIRWLSKNNLRS